MLSCVPVAGQQLVLIVSKDHPLARYEEADLEQTLSYPYIYFSPGSGVRYDIDLLFEKIGKRPRIAYETEEDQVIAGLTAKNFGISIVPEMDLLDHLDIKKIKIKNSTSGKPSLKHYLPVPGYEEVLPAAPLWKQNAGFPLQGL